MKVLNSTSASGSVATMRDGDVAEILEWPRHPDMVGKVVQLFGTCIIRIGERKGKSFPDVRGWARARDIKVKILKKGDVIVFDDHPDE